MDMQGSKFRIADSGVQIELEERGGFFQAVHEVEVLDGGAGGAFDQVIDRADDDNAASDGADRDVAEVRAGDLFSRWQVIGYADESFVPVELSHDVEQRFLVEFAGRFGVTR